MVRRRPPGTLGIDDRDRFRGVVRAAFGQRRKKLSNGLKSLEAGERLEELGLAALRAGEVTVADYLKIVRELSP